MIQLLDDFYAQSLNEDFKSKLADREVQSRVVGSLYTWLINIARKKPLPDLDQRCQDMKVEFEHLVKSMEVKVQDGKCIVKASGSAEDTLKKLRLGSTWFEGSPDVLELVLTGLFNT